MMHRLREAMRTGGLEPLGGAGKVVEADEAYFGKAQGQPACRPSAVAAPTSRRARSAATTVLSSPLLSAAGECRSFHVPVADAGNVAAIVRDNVHRESRLHTDESALYPVVGARVRHTRDRQAFRQGICAVAT